MICFKCGEEEFTEKMTTVCQEFHGEQLDVWTPVSACNACGGITLNFRQTDVLRKRLDLMLQSRMAAAGVIIFAALLGSGCSTNGRYADGLDHWPVQVHSVDSGSN